MIYYVDSKYGCDNNDGLSRQTAFRTIEKINSLKLLGGDSILFKAGCIYEGCLIPKRLDDIGVISIDRYGTGENPLVLGNGTATVDLVDISYIDIRHLSVTNPEGLYGIRVYNTLGGEMRHIHVVNCRVYNVYGGHDKFSIMTGGIVMTSGRENPAWFRDLLIQDNHVHDVCRTGIILITYWANRPKAFWGENQYISDTENWYPSYEVVFRGNLIERPAGDAMVLVGGIEPLMEWNTAYEVMANPKPPCANAGIWPQSTEHCVVQYNEVGYSHKPEGCNDAQGFDVDLSCRNTVVQYNYSHDNEGGFLLLCEHPNTEDQNYRGTIVRNNLSVNDGNTKGELFALVGPVRGVTIENNTIYSSGNVDRIVEVWTDDGTDQAKDVTFRNNLFISNGRDNKFNLSNGENFVFENNCYWGAYRTPAEGEVNPIVVDPRLTCDGASGCGRDSAGNYVPLSDSPLLINGTLPLKGADKDFFVNSTNDISYIGAFVGGKKK